MSRKKLENLDHNEYEHPFDHKALETLQKTPGLDKVLRELWEHGLEKMLRVQHTSSNIKVNKRNFPKIYSLFTEAREILNVPDTIDLYIEQNPVLNAYTTGVEKPIMVLNTSIVDFLTDEELQCVIGHELGHIKSRHVLYNMTAQIISMVGQMAGQVTLGIGELLAIGVQIPLLHWSQMAELTADRAGLLACQDINVATSVEMKLSGVPYSYVKSMTPLHLEEWIKQAKEFQEYDYDSITKWLKYWVLLNPWGGRSHPFSVIRTLELMKWMDAGDYEKVFTRKTYKPPVPGVSALSCRTCGANLKGDEAFCPICGQKVQKEDLKAASGPACQFCGCRLKGDEAFCPGCGKKIQKAG